MGKKRSGGRAQANTREGSASGKDGAGGETPRWSDLATACSRLEALAGLWRRRLDAGRRRGPGGALRGLLDRLDAAASVRDVLDAAGRHAATSGAWFDDLRRAGEAVEGDASAVSRLNDSWSLLRRYLDCIEGLAGLDEALGESAGDEQERLSAAAESAFRVGVEAGRLLALPEVLRDALPSMIDGLGVRVGRRKGAASGRATAATRTETLRRLLQERLDGNPERGIDDLRSELAHDLADEETRRRDGLPGDFKAPSLATIRRYTAGMKPRSK